MRMRWFIVWMSLVFGGSAAAEGIATLGVGRFFNNDYLGDGHDRWQSGSYTLSIVRGRARLHSTMPFGEVWEYRLRSALMASDGRGPAPGDRPYIGALSFGVHAHIRAETTQATLGIDVTAVGPQTGVSRFQRRAHDLLGMREVAFVDQQLGDATFLSVTADLAETVSLSERAVVRPFAEVQAGAEDMIRVGVDALIGADYRTAIWVRDVTTGHLYPTARGTPGVTLSLGADVATVAGSRYLPRHQLRDRARIRAGVQWQSAEKTRIFYGLTYLSPEFQGQREGQVVGSLQLQIHF